VDELGGAALFRGDVAERPAAVGQVHRPQGVPGVVQVAAHVDQVAGDGGAPQVGLLAGTLGHVVGAAVAAAHVQPERGERFQVGTGGHVGEGDGDRDRPVLVRVIHQVVVEVPAFPVGHV